MSDDNKNPPDDENKSEDTTKNEPEAKKEKVVTGKRFKVLKGGKTEDETSKDTSNDDNGPDNGDDNDKQKLVDKFNTPEPQSGKIVAIGTIFAVVALGMVAAIVSSRRPK